MHIGWESRARVRGRVAMERNLSYLRIISSEFMKIQLLQIVILYILTFSIQKVS